MRCGFRNWRTVALLVAALMLGSCASTEKNGSTLFVSGTVNYRERMALPPDAVVEVQLLDVSRQDAPATIVAAASFSTHGRQVPIPFTLPYDPAKIVEKHIYAVRAVIRSEGAMVFTTTSQYPVITRGNPSRVDLMLERVGKTKSHTVEAPSIARTEAPASAKSVASSADLLGIWTVVGHHIPGISAMSDADAKAWHGRTVRLTAKQAMSPESHCDEPAYTTDSVTKDRFLGREFNLPPGSLTPLASLEHITVLQVFCGRGHWTAMGGRMIGIEKDRVLAFWNGVFFELARDRDFRAAGQEPFWRLEFHKGKELCFTHDLGKRETVTPAPVPANVLATGTSVYHAVTEANDLRVVIEATRCTDVMSGRPFEKTVTVTLNRQTYHGCGESVE